MRRHHCVTCIESFQQLVGKFLLLSRAAVWASAEEQQREQRGRWDVQDVCAVSGHHSCSNNAQESEMTSIASCAHLHSKVKACSVVEASNGGSRERSSRLLPA